MDQDEEVEVAMEEEDRIVDLKQETDLLNVDQEDQAEDKHI